MSDWDNSDEEEKVVVKPVVPKSKWEGEDDEGKDVVSDWEASSDDEEKKAAAAAKPATAPPKKKGTLKAKLAQKEAELAARRAAGELTEEDESEMHPRERERIAREREIQADLKNAEELLGAVSVSSNKASGNSELDSIINMNPKTKEDFTQLSSLIIQHILKQHENKPLYASFIEQHVRDICVPLKDLEVRKAASALTTLANEKQKEQKDKASGKKKPKAGVKTAGPAKAVTKIDTNAYEEALDDFGNDPNDFM